MASILVVDDDRHIREVVRFALEQAGHRVTEAADGAQACVLSDRESFDVIVLDILMPGMDGLDVCRRIRQRTATPIVFLSSRDEELDRVLGLELGADDYLGKPFSPRELVARVKAILRRAQAAEGPPAEGPARLAHGALELDLERHRCTWAGREVVLTVTEFALLRVLVQRPGRVFSRQDLVERAYGHGHYLAERTVDSHVRRIRHKLAEAGGSPIETVHGAGYRLRETP